MNRDRFLENLAREAEANPTLALGVAAGLITALSQLLKSMGVVKNARSWDRETKRRAKKDATKY